MVGNLQSNTGNRRSRISNRQSGTGNLQFRIGNRQPTIGNRQPTIKDWHSAIQDGHSAIQDWQSTIHDWRSAIGNRRLAIGNRGSTIGNRGSTIGSIYGCLHGDMAIHALFGTSRHCLHDESTLLAPSVRPGVVVQRGGDGQICSGLGDSRRCRSLGRLVSRDLHLTPAATVVVVLCVLTTIC